MISRFLAIVVISISLWSLAPASIAMAQQLDEDVGPAPMVQIQLDPSVAIQAINVYLTLRETVGTEQLEALSQESSDESLTALVPGLMNVLVNNGFASEDEWMKALQSVVIAYEALQDNSLEKSQESLAELKADISMPQEQKAQLEKVLESMMPSDNNLDVVRKMMRDPEMNAKLAQALEEM